MEFTDREIRLIMLALDNTACDLSNEATATGSEEVMTESDDMDTLYSRFQSELIVREGAQS